MGSARRGSNPLAVESFAVVAVTVATQAQWVHLTYRLDIFAHGLQHCSRATFQRKYRMSEIVSASICHAHFHALSEHASSVEHWRECPLCLFVSGLLQVLRSDRPWGTLSITPCRNPQSHICSHSANWLSSEHAQPWFSLVGDTLAAIGAYIFLHKPQFTVFLPALGSGRVSKRAPPEICNNLKQLAGTSKAVAARLRHLDV